MPGFREKLVGAEVALVFDDVVLLPGYTRVEPWQVDISSKFSTSIALSVPLASSPMDTVTEWEMAVAMSLSGGIGVIHRNMSREEQVEHVKRVKSHPVVKLSRVALSHITPCGTAKEVMRDLGLRTLPVVDDEGMFKGYVVYGDLDDCRYVGEASRSGLVFKLGEEVKALRAVQKGDLDVAAFVDSDGKLIGVLTPQDSMTPLEPVVDEEGRLRVAAAISPFDLERAKMLDKYADALVVDVAHAHNENVISALRRLVKEINTDLVVGNIGTYEAAEDIVSRLEKVDGLRVGVASGSICKTGVVTGAAAPTLYAVASVRDALESMGLGDKLPIIADGGVKSAGDAAKALAVGAWSVMAGRLLAGTDEAPSPLIRIGERLYKPYRGMASKGAMERRWALDRYSRRVKRVEEGVEGLVEYKGSVFKVIEEFKEALKAALGYAGASSIKELWRKARLAKLSPRGFQEVNPHSILV